MNIHIIGLAGSGKTSLARALSTAHGIPAIDLDYEVYGPTGERPASDLKARLNGILSREGWVTEGEFPELHPPHGIRATDGDPTDPRRPRRKGNSLSLVERCRVRHPQARQPRSALVPQNLCVLCASAVNL